MQTTNDNNFGYNLTPFRNRSSFNLTVYSSDTKSEYKWHTDASSNPYKDIKLTEEQRNFACGNIYRESPALFEYYRGNVIQFMPKESFK